GGHNARSIGAVDDRARRIPDRAVITDVPVRPAVMMAEMTAVATMAAMHSMTATVAATVHSVTAATMTAAVTAGAGNGGAEQCKAKRCARGDGQKGRFA